MNYNIDSVGVTSQLKVSQWAIDTTYDDDFWLVFNVDCFDILRMYVYNDILLNSHIFLHWINYIIQSACDINFLIILINM